MLVTNLFGDLANDLSIKNIIRKLSNLSFASDSSLRVSGAVTVATVTTVTTVTKMTTGNMGFGDMGKPSTAMSVSANTFYGSVGKNFTRS